MGVKNRNALVSSNDVKKSIMYSVQVATLERILADGLIDEEEHKALLGKIRSKYNVLSDVDIIGG